MRRTCARRQRRCPIRFRLQRNARAVPSTRPVRVPHNAAEADVTGRRVNGLRDSAPPAGSAGSSSVRRGASRPSAPAAECEAGARSCRSSALWRRRGDCAERSTPDAIRRMLRRVPVGRPFPDVADHVDEAVAVRRETCRPATCPRSRRASGSARGTRPARCSPCACPSGVSSSPHAYSAASRPPRAANSHSASVGSALPAHRGVGRPRRRKATCTTG